MAVKAKAQISVVNLAVETETLADVVTRVTETEAKIKENSDNITSTVKKTETIETTLGKTNETVTTHSSQISTLQQTAEGFEARITSNKTAAAAAKSTADTAKSNAATAQTTADDAKSAAAAAQSTADTAKTNAATAQTTAEAAKSTADSASASAATAQTAAEGAQSTADTAVTNAATAQSTANTARTEASDAAKTATNYLKFSEDTGLLIGDMTTDTVGYNTQILSDGINLRSGSTTLAEYGETITIGDSSSFNTHITDSALEIRDGTKVLASYQGETISLGYDSSAQINLLNGEGVIGVDESSDWFNIESTKRYCVLRSELGSFLLSAIRDNDDSSNYRRASVCARARKNLDLTAYMEVIQGRSNGKNAIVKLLEDNILIDSHIGYTGGNVNTYTDRTYISLGYDDGLEFCSTKDISMNVSGKSFKPYYTAGDSITTSANLRLNGFITNSGSQLYFSIPLSKPMVGVTKATITNHASKSLIIRQAGDYVWGSAGSTWINPTSWSVSLEEGMINVTATSSSNTYKNNYPAAILFRGTITFS